MKNFFLFFFVLACCTVGRAQVNEAQLKFAMDLVKKNQAAAGLSDVDLGNSIVTNTYVVPGTAIRMIYLQQSFKNIPVYNRLHVMAFKNDELVSNAGSRVPMIEDRLTGTVSAPSIRPVQAVETALLSCDLHTSKSIVAEKIYPGGKKMQFGTLGVSTENITAELIWFPMDDGDELKLAWQVFVAPTNSSDYWLVRINAADNSLINKESLTVYCNWDDPSHAKQHSHTPAKPAKKNLFQSSGPNLVNNATYRVVPYPAESPIHPGGAHALETNPWQMAPGNATTLGWHFDGVLYHNNTRGNNVYAYEDRNNDNLPGASPVSTTPQPDLNFNFTPNYTLEPTITTPSPNQQFNTTNLFYWNNLVHDLVYIYGFTEAARNFQNDNQGRGGFGLDYVQAEAQDGGGTNNANFATPPDGTRPRMQMYLWNAPTPDRDGDVDNGIIIHEYGHGISNRMTGTGSGCLSNAEQMGEGWSDYFALMMTHDWSTALPGDGFSKPRGIGTYALNQAVTGVGIRQYRYTTDMSVNPLTYANLPTVIHPHGTGTVWCTVLWDMTWEIIQMAGINPNLHNIAGNGGNVIALKLVTEGLRLQPCSPGFITGRNAILKADTLFFGAQYSCAIINAFARRGMGIGASQGSSGSRTDQTVSYVGCTPACDAPGGLTSSFITTNSATVSWAAAAGAASYDVDYKTNSSATWINAATATTGTSVHLTGLNASTLYDWRVRTNCSSTSSAYAQSAFTTATPACNVPGGLTSSSITTNSATVSWGAVAGAVSYTVDYKANSSSTWINAATATTAISVNLTGLSASTLYDWRVSSNCSSNSSIHAQAQFTTATAPSGCPGIYDVSTNGTLPGAADIPFDTDVKGLINPANDKDHYRFQVSAAGSYTLSLTNLPANYDLRLLNASGTRLNESKRNGSNNESITRNLSVGTYYALVLPKGGASHPTLCYNLHVSAGAVNFDGGLMVFDRVNLFPNPVSRTLNINIPSIQGTATIRIFDMYGKQLMLKHTTQASSALNIATLAPGYYMVKILNNDKESVFRIVKQ